MPLLGTMVLQLIIFTAVIIGTLCWCLCKLFEPAHDQQFRPHNKVPEYAEGVQRVHRVHPQAGQAIPREFNEFIKKVIRLFHGQRLQGDQFAVLIFTAENRLNRMGEMQFQPRDPLVNKRYPYFPRINLGNYIVARPDEGRHSEMIIFYQSHLLQDIYRNVNPRCIILYSWIFPCTGCTNEILRYYRNILPPRPEMIVVYTVQWDELADEENERNIFRMRQAEIIVERVRYFPGLPPA